MSCIGIDIVREKADELMKKYLVDELKDPRALEWWGPNWSLISRHGRWSVCHGGYGGFVTNASMERAWREDKEP